MNRTISFLYKIMVFCLLAASIVVLVVSSLTTIYYELHSDVDQPIYGSENIPRLIICLIVVMVVFLFLYLKNYFEKYRIFTIGSLVFITGYSLMLLWAIRPRAVDDALLVDKAINEIMAGNYTSLTEPGGYLYTWPFQLGYVAFGQVMALIFGESNFMAWELVQLVCILITMYLIYQITWEIFRDRIICGITGLMAFGALFFYNYVTFIYGDILSMAPQTISLYMMILYLKRKKIWYAVVSALAIGFAIILKTNCEVTLIALVGVLVLEGLFPEKNPLQEAVMDSGSEKKADGVKKSVLTTLGLALFFVAVTFAFKGAVDAYYCKASGLNEIPKGNPAWAHIAMGLQESDLEDGWYNGYNYRVFKENNYDTEATAKAAKEDLRKTLEKFAKNPLYAGRYMARKFTTQWADSVAITTHNLDLVSRHVENQPPLCDFLVFGKGQRILVWVMNVFMPVCYAGVSVYLFGIIKGRKFTYHEMLLLVLIFGGMLFHQFWEGSSRYTMRYYIYWLPYGAFGLKVLLGRIEKFLIRKI